MKWALVPLLLIIVSFTACDVDELLKKNEPPQVSDIFCDKPQFIVQPLDTAKFWVTATNPQEGALTYEWGANLGEYIGSRQNDTLRWRAPVTGGTYNVWVTVSNSEESITRNREVNVPSLQAPFVEITAPRNNDFVVQNTNVDIFVFASSENGIFQTQLFVNDSLVNNQSGNSSEEYQFIWSVQEPAGPAELKVVAIAKGNGLTGQDAITVNIEGVVPGKN